MRELVFSISYDVFINDLSEFLDLSHISSLVIRILIYVHSGLLPLLLFQVGVNLHQDFHLAETSEAEVNIDNLIVILRVCEALMVTHLLFSLDHFL